MDQTDKEERLHKRRERERYAGNIPYALPPVVGFLSLLLAQVRPLMIIICLVHRNVCMKMAAYNVIPSWISITSLAGTKFIRQLGVLTCIVC